LETVSAFIINFSSMNFLSSPDCVPLFHPPCLIVGGWDPHNPPGNYLFVPCSFSFSSEGWIFVQSQHLLTCINISIFQTTRCSAAQGCTWPRTLATGPAGSPSPRASPGGSPCCSSTRSRSSPVRSSQLRKYPPQLSKEGYSDHSNICSS